MIKNQYAPHSYMLEFPLTFPGRRDVKNAVNVTYSCGKWAVRRWEAENYWIEVGEYSTQEEADQAAEVIYNMRLFSR